MTDMHSHILPYLDDGSRTVHMSLSMLRFERIQGVRTVCLTPHFYRDMETPEVFFSKREESFQRLLRFIDREPMPDLILGAEVAWVPNIAEWDELPAFCYAGTNLLLLEPPFRDWRNEFFQSVESILDRRGLIPVIAHLDRYLAPSNAEGVRRLLSYELPVQLSASFLLSAAGRGEGLRLLKSGAVQHLISDAHNTTTRPPNLGQAMDYLRNKLGSEAEAIFYRTDALLRKATRINIGERKF